MTLNERIVQIANSYVGQEELQGNSGFKETWFQNLLVKVGWKKGEAWCAYLGKEIWLEAFREFDREGTILILKYANGSSVNTYQNFAKSKEFHVQQQPELGALVIFRLGNGSSGHEGIVTSIAGSSFTFVSGNTSKEGSREGTSVLPKTRKIYVPFGEKSLNLMGFVVCRRIA